MKTTANILIALTILACIVALTISIYPGVLNDLLFLALLLSFLIVPIIGIIVAVMLIILSRKGKLEGMRFPWRKTAVVLAILFCTFVLLLYYVPRRIAFAASRSSFEQLVPRASSEFESKTLNRRLGVYLVDEYAADPRGGVYFRVYSGPDGISPDQISYGFVYKPNTEGTPFGAAQYRMFNLGNDWYWFRASNDW